jgi:hypothetical protein
MYRAFPTRKGKPEGWPKPPAPGRDWIPGDGSQEKRKAAYELAHARTAMEISHLTGETIDAALFHLRQLEDWGVIRHSTDTVGVVRWVRVEGNPWDQPLPF